MVFFISLQFDCPLTHNMWLKGPSGKGAAPLVDEANVEDAITCQKPRNFKRVHPEFFKCNGNIIERTRTADRKESDSTNALQQENALTLSKMEPMENARAPKRRLKIVHAHNTQGEENYQKIYLVSNINFNSIVEASNLIYTRLRIFMNIYSAFWKYPTICFFRKKQWKLFRRPDSHRTIVPRGCVSKSSHGRERAQCQSFIQYHCKLALSNLNIQNLEVRC